MPIQTLALDVYGTLIDTTGVLSLLKELVGEQANELSNRWRNKQLEYSFRRGLMDRYVDFSVVTREALVYSCRVMGIQLSDEEVAQLLERYRVLPAFADARAGVQALRAAGHRVFAYSNGSRRAVTELLERADILPILDGVVSMEDVQTFKPNPVGYRHFCQSTGTSPRNAWLVSGNTFDVIGATSYSMHSAWLTRKADNIFDPMGFEPTVTIGQLTELSTVLKTFLQDEK